MITQRIKYYDNFTIKTHIEYYGKKRILYQRFNHHGNIIYEINDKFVINFSYYPTQQLKRKIWTQIKQSDNPKEIKRYNINGTLKEEKWSGVKESSRKLYHIFPSQDDFVSIQNFREKDYIICVCHTKSFFIVIQQNISVDEIIRTKEYIILNAIESKLKAYIIRFLNKAIKAKTYTQLCTSD